MKHTRWTPMVALAGLLLAGCSDDPADLRASELWGLWAAVEMVFTSQADPSVEADLVGLEGATYSIELRSDGTYLSLLSGWMQGSVEEHGSYEIRGGQLILDPDGGARRTLDLSFNQSLLTAYEANATFDFDGDGTAEDATLHMVLDRH